LRPLFSPSRTLTYWPRWAFLLVYGAPGLAIVLSLLERDPVLLKRRMRGGPGYEKEPAQKLVMSRSRFSG
jgi:hypothetical protein